MDKRKLSLNSGIKLFSDDDPSLAARTKVIVESRGANNGTKALTRSLKTVRSRSSECCFGGGGGGGALVLHLTGRWPQNHFIFDQNFRSLLVLSKYRPILDVVTA